MKLEWRIVLVFALVGAGLWVLDAAVDGWFFHNGRFVTNLVPHSGQEIYQRSSILLGFAILGVVAAVDIRSRRLTQEKMHHLNLVLGSIRRVEQDIRKGGTPEQLVHQICQDLVSDGAYVSAWISLRDATGKYQLTAESGLGEQFDGGHRRIECEQYARCMDDAMSQDQVVVIDGPEHDCEDCPLGGVYQGTGSLSMRIASGGDIFGVLVASLPRRLVREEQEHVLFREVVADLSSALRSVDLEQDRRKAELALDQARKREMDVGFKMQQMLLFQRPPDDVTGASIAAITIPSQQVDGDFYDFFKHSDHCFDVIVADVMGKGTLAALLGAATKAHFMRAISHLVAGAGEAHLPQPRDIVTYVHREVTRQLIELESFVTAIYARFDMSQGRLTFVDCGHAKPLLFRGRTGTCETLEGQNLFLGADIREVYEQHTVKIEPGDQVLIYSDGVIEAADRAQSFFGMERLRGLVESAGRQDPVKLIDRIMMDLITFAGVNGPSDDMTCVAVKIRHLEASPPLGKVELDLSSDPAELARIRGFVLGLSRRLPIVLVDEQDISRLELAVNEAASNIMRHAYQGKPDQRIRLEADIFADRLVIRLYHWGVPYDAVRQAAARRNPTQVGGFGLSIMEQCVDQVRYRPGPDGSHYVELTKIISRS